MAKLTFSGDPAPPPPIDTALLKFVQQNPDKPLKLRLQPDVYDHANSRYSSWAGLVWLVEVDSIAEAKRLREGLTDFFKLFGNSEAQGQILNALDVAAQLWDRTAAGTCRIELGKVSVDKALPIGPVGPGDGSRG